MNVSRKLDEHQVDLRKKERKKGREEKKGGEKKGKGGGGGREGEALAPVALVVHRALNIRNLCTTKTLYTPKKLFWSREALGTGTSASHGQCGHFPEILDSGDHYCDLGAPNPNPNPNPNPKSKPNLG